MFQKVLPFIATHFFKAWILASRPKTFSAAIIPILLTSSELSAPLPITFLVVVTALQIQIITNFVNDLFDFKKGADSESRLGPQRMVQAGLISEQAMTGAIFGLCISSVLCGIPLFLMGGLWIVVIGLLSLLCAVAYTAGPIPLAYKGLGEPFVFFFFGPIATVGTALICGNGILVTPSKFLLLGVSCGMFATALLVVNNLRDREQDVKVGKFTLAVRLGDRGTRIEFVLLMTLASLLPLAGLYFHLIAPLPVLLSALFSSGVLYVCLLQVIRGAMGASLNSVLGTTSLCYVLFALGYLLGLFLA